MTSAPDFSLPDIADGTLAGPEIDAWLAANPAAAAEVALTRRVRALLSELSAQEIAVPPVFEARVLARVRADTTLWELLDLGLSGFGRALLELLALLFSFIPDPQTAS
jgi:anti-sigma factor RsiW